MSTPRASRAKTPRFSWADVPLADQKAILDQIGGDGHTIWNPDMLKSEAGLNARAIDYFTRTQKSDGSWKGSIWDSVGNMIPEVQAVYGLDLIRSLATYYDVHSHAFGRGTEARELTRGTREKIEYALAERAAIDDVANEGMGA